MGFYDPNEEISSGRSDFTPKPGTYSFKVDQIKATQNKKGGPQLEVLLLVDDGAPWGDSRVKTWVQRWDWRKFAESIGQNYDDPPESPVEWEGSFGMASFGLREYNGKQYLDLLEFVTEVDAGALAAEGAGSVTATEDNVPF